MNFEKANYRLIKVPGVYRIVNRINGKVYVGSSSNLYHRIRAQQWLLAHGQNHNPDLQIDFDRYGKDSFVFEVIELCEGNRLVREEFWIRHHDAVASGYNFSGSAHRPRLGVKTRPETRAKMSIAQRRRYAN